MTTRSAVTKVAMMGVLAGVVAVVTPQKAEAQGFAVGVQIGHPVYPVYGYGYEDRRAFYEHERWERERLETARAAEIARQRAYFAHERHDAWEHERFHDHYGYYGR